MTGRQRSPESRLITINGGSSSIKFAVFTLHEQPRRTLSGVIARIGTSGTSFVATDVNGRAIERRALSVADHGEGAEHLAHWLHTQLGNAAVAGIGHRVVHGGVRFTEHQAVTDELIEELRRVQPLDLAHLPGEIALIEVFERSLAQVPQVACFDTAFHRELPRVAKLLPIPRQFDRAGVRRLGFHGLSYEYLMAELRRISPREAEGRVILAHLGAGASMAAVRHGKPIDTSMAFTPTAGLVMGTRPGDLDPGLLVYLMRLQNLSPDELDHFLSRRCGMLGVSEISADMRDLLALRSTDVRAAEAVDLFCYQARKWIGAFAAAMGGLDGIVFAGGIGEHSPEVRAGICDQLQFLGLRLDQSRNGADADVISADDSRIVVRVTPTDEEVVIARIVRRILGLNRIADTGPTDQ
jgi:acetate kinase